MFCDIVVKDEQYFMLVWKIFIFLKIYKKDFNCNFGFMLGDFFLLVDIFVDIDIDCRSQ